MEVDVGIDHKLNIELVWPKVKVVTLKSDIVDPAHMGMPSSSGSSKTAGGPERVLT